MSQWVWKLRLGGLRVNFVRRHIFFFFNYFASSWIHTLSFSHDSHLHYSQAPDDSYPGHVLSSKCKWQRLSWRVTEGHIRRLISLDKIQNNFIWKGKKTETALRKSSGWKPPPQRIPKGVKAFERGTRNSARKRYFAYARRKTLART